MQFGVHMSLTDESMDAHEFGRAVEDHGFDAVSVPEHTHIPAARTTPYPGGGELPREYTRTLDPFVALTAIAGVTERVRLMTSVCLLVERDPIITAKAGATLDLLSDGRLDLGVGAGWNREEMVNHGTDPRRRFALLDERLGALRALWTEPEASYHGELVDFKAVWSWPKPLQQPHVPILVGGSGPSALERVLTLGDGWLPHGRTPELPERIRELRHRARETGRGPIPVTVFAAEANDAALEAYVEAGADRCLFRFPSSTADEVLPRLEEHARLAARWAAA